MIIKVTFSKEELWRLSIQSRQKVDMGILTTRKQTFHPASIFAFSPGIFVFGTKGTISPGCILKQGYKVPAPSVWRRQATISPGYSPEPGLKVIL